MSLKNYSLFDSTENVTDQYIDNPNVTPSEIQTLIEDIEKDIQLFSNENSQVTDEELTRLANCVDRLCEHIVLLKTEEYDRSWRREIALEAGAMYGRQAYYDHVGVSTSSEECYSCLGRGCYKCD